MCFALPHCCRWPFQVCLELYDESRTTKAWCPAMKKTKFLCSLEQRIQHLIKGKGLEHLKLAGKVPKVKTSAARNTPPSCADLGLPKGELFVEVPVAEVPQDPESLKRKFEETSDSAPPEPRESTMTKEQKTALERHMHRIREETYARVLLANKKKLWWTQYYPWDDTKSPEDLEILRARVKLYLETGFMDHLGELCALPLLGSMRLLTTETQSILNYMAMKRILPHNLISPHDKYIRFSAGAEISAEHYYDPGNDKYCVLWHLLRLDKFVSEVRVKDLIKTPATEYGTARNKSSTGVVNFRGNIIESLLAELQTQSERPSKGKGKKRS